MGNGSTREAGERSRWEGGNGRTREAGGRGVMIALEKQVGGR